jgi:uncharacterized protein YecT (DUF1311 family)
VFKLFIMGIILIPAAALADCNEPANDAERARCVGQDLRASDTAINDTYSQLRARLSPEGQSDLRHQEIAWIKARAQTCQVDTREPDRDKWLAALLTDYSKTVCVVRFTDQRVAELRAQLAALTRPAPAASAPLPPLLPLPPPLPDTPPPGSGQVAAGDIFRLVAHKIVFTGKWYFEVSYDQSAIAKTASADFFVGVNGVNFSNVGTLQTIHKRNIGLPPVTIGVAEDLDDGKLYISMNGAWRATPGSAGGLDLKLGRPYLSQLTSSVPLNPYLDQGLVRVNFGERAFAYALPGGYVPLDNLPPRRLTE